MIRLSAALTVFLVSWMATCGSGRSVHADVQVAVLRNGNILQGDVTRQAAHVIVRSAGTHIRLASADVEMVAPDLKTAHRRKSAQTADHDTTSRCQLIRWCVRHGLREEAIEELETLEKYHPYHPQLHHLRQLVNTHRSDWTQTALPLPAPLHPDRAHVTKVRDQLSKTSVSQFVRVIQPLLLNRCGQASCHGTATNTSYQLTPSRWSRVPLGTTERNLGATLRKIGTLPPPETVLWMSAASLHGPLSTKPLGRSEMQVLLAWIRQVSAELTGRQASNDSQVLGIPSSAARPADVLFKDPFDPAAFNAGTANAPTPPSSP